MATQDNQDPVIDFRMKADMLRSVISAQLLAAMLSRENPLQMSDAKACRIAVDLADTLLQVLDES